jgi:glutamate-1-semialdehyde 2,1-aminomutase
MNHTKSAVLLERAKKSLAGGVSSEFRKYNYPHALFYSHSKGVYIYDVDGNEYLDFTLSQGPMIVGHSHPHVLKRINDYSEKGQLFAGQHILEVELAEKLQKHIPSAELMRFCLDGSTAVQTALRVARAKTGKQKFIRFEGHYHGWLDNVSWGLTLDSEKIGAKENPIALPWSQGIANNTQDEFIILPWNDLDLVEKTMKEHFNDVAAIITEPIMCNSGCIMPKDGFLEGLRNICNTYGTTLIFDEVITGFRTSMGGAQKLFNVTPDLSIFAKALASGYPISAIVGKREWMKLLEDGTVIHAGTMNSACALVAAAIGTIEVLEQDEDTHERMFRLGKMLMEGLKEASNETGHNLLVQGLGPMFHTGFSNKDSVTSFREMAAYDKEKSKLFVSKMHENGVRIIGRGLWYISAVHNESHIEKAINVAKKVLTEIK